MSMDRNVMANVCRMPSGGGHNMASILTGMVKDPSTNTLIPQYEVLCTRCGGTLDSIAEDVRARRSGKVGRRAKNAPTLLSPPPPIGSNDVEDL